MSYYLRVGGVFAVLGVVAVWLGVASLAPAFFLVDGDLATINTEILAHTKGAENENMTEGSVTEVRDLLGRLEPHITPSPLTGYLTTVFTDQPASIRVTGLAYDKTQRTLALEGTATTRSDLVAYVARLESLKEITHVALPISDLARNTDLTFKITVSFATE